MIHIIGDGVFGTFLKKKLGDMSAGTLDSILSNKYI